MSVLMTEEGLPEGVRVFNYARSATKGPAAEEVPILNDAAFKALSAGDDAPFFRIEAIDYPAKGKGGVYEKSFFQSFLDVARDRPIPGSKRGHEFNGRPSSDFYTVGGKLVDNADGKTGTAFLKIYVPPAGDITENAGFIRDARAGIVHFSIVTSPEYTVKAERDEAGNSVQVYHFTATKGYERNDAVEYGGGAMQQVVNSSGRSEPAPEPSGITMEALGDSSEHYIPEISVGAANQAQDPGDGIPTITIGGTK